MKSNRDFQIMIYSITVCYLVNKYYDDDDNDNESLTLLLALQNTICFQ